NPTSPPMFCMIMRKHLEGGKIIDVRQHGLERLITIEVQNYNEYGDLAVLHLNLEIMGKHSNLILVDPATNIILDGLKRYSHALSRYREVLPGRAYLIPPSQDKLDPLHEEDKWRQEIFSFNLDTKVQEVLVTRFAGISPELAREICLRAGLEEGIRLHECGDIDFSRLFQWYAKLANPDSKIEISPCLYFYSSKNPIPAAFSFTPYRLYEGLVQESVRSVNETVRRFYDSKTRSNTLEAKRGSLKKLVQEHRGHLNKKISIYEEAINSSKENYEYQKWGELLTANLYRIQPGAKKIEVEDYTQDSLPSLTIPLDPALSGIENAQRYYRLYNKAKATIQKTAPLREAALEELSYLDTVLLSLEQAASQVELDEIHAELVEQNYLAGKHFEKRNAKNKKASSKPESPQPKEFVSSAGRTILVGKNNRQNDWLTLRRSNPGDLWLHVKNTPGSHVLIPLNESEEFPDDATLEEAAALAIHFSQAKGSTLVPVDYTHIKNIKKPNAAKPGMVVYEKNWTLYLTPEEQVLERLLESEKVNS
ncbi:MAG: NFACT RNA binding domain-containing protein, partial [Desulfitobacterium hafniense]|nr:NFACT RNA binding domain-containing protein [Desulfitobacterium hafniense]